MAGHCAALWFFQLRRLDRFIANFAISIFPNSAAPAELRLFALPACGRDA
jgi:hypothetical protein